MTTLTAQQTATLAAWEAKKNELTEAQNLVSRLKEQELDLRIKVAHSGITTQAEGVNTAALGNGFQLKATIKYTYKIDNENKRVLDKQLAKLPDDVADRLIAWKPTLVLTEYRKLDAKHKNIADTFITTTEAAPVVEIKAPK
jgi:hypothetical protein